MHRVETLPSGLTVATSEMPHMNSVSLGLFVGVGGRYENAHDNGICHFIEHMLFKGTRKRTAREISEDVEGVGGYLNAWTNEEITCYHARAQASRFEELLDVLTDMFLNSLFDPVELDKERSVIKEELAMYLDQPHHHVQELLNETLWPDHALGRPLTGTATTLDRFRREHLIHYKQTNYLSPTMVIACAGNVEHRQVVEAVKKLTRHFQTGTRPDFLPWQETQSAPRVRLFTKKTEQTQIAIGIKTCSRHDARRYPLRLLNAILGENMSSRLFQVIREEHGLAYTIYSGTSYFDDAGLLTISAGLDAENLPKTLRLIAKESARLRQELVGASELRRARDYVLGQMDLSLEHTDNQMNWLGEQWLGYGRLFTPEEVRENLLKVRGSDIRRVAQEFLTPAGLNLAIVSPLKSSKGLLDCLQISG